MTGLLAMFCLIFFASAQNQTQQVTAIQYFYNNDPGVGVAGNGAIVSVTPSASISQLFSLGLPSSLTNGINQLYIRARDESGQWSIAERRTFYLFPTPVTKDIAEIQYYFDADPGAGVSGNGAIIPVTPSSAINQMLAITIPGTLNSGFHNLFVRTSDVSGRWSIAERRTFYIFNTYNNQNIAAIQYFFDADPGVGVAGNGTIIPVTPGSPINQMLAITIPGTLNPGFHTLFVRTKDESGRWSIAERRTFYIFGTGNSQNITAIQYYFDIDPGVGVPGNGAIIPVTPASTVNQPLAITIPGTLSNDYHYLFIRTQDESGSWSIAERRQFAVGVCTNSGTDDIISWWSFDDESAAPVKDIAGGHAGILVNGATTSLHAQFDGIDDYIGIPDDSLWAFGANDFTIEFLANFSSPGGDLQHPGDKFIGQSEGPGDSKKWTFALGGGQLFFRLSYGATSQNLVQFPFAPTLDQWYHLALTRSRDTLRTFINGQLSGMQVVNNLVIPDVNSALTIGWVDWVQGGDQGYMAGQLDEMTVHSRALTVQEIMDITNAGILGGKCKDFHIVTPVLADVLFGQPFSQTIETMFGVTPMAWSVAEGTLPPGVTLNYNGILSGTPSQAGEFAFTAQVTDNLNFTAQKEFTIKVLLTLPEPKMTIFKSGTTSVPGRVTDYFILVENTGSVADTAFITEFLEPWFTYISSDPPAKIFAYMPNFITTATNDSIPFVIQWKILVLPGESKVITYKVKLSSDFPVGDTVTGCACLTTDEEEYCKKQYIACNIGYMIGCATACAPLLLIPWQYAACVLGCGELIRFYLCDSQLYKCLLDETRDSDPECSCHKGPAPAGKDPNEKLVLAEKYIQSDQLLVYPVYFENIGTIEAQDVFVTDVLDTNLDLSTLNIFSLPGSSFDEETRTLRWDLYGINLEPDSSSYVLYSIKPKPGLPSGTVIRNTASIQFEELALMNTNETINIIDSSRPEGIMDSLPSTMYQTAFPISWSGKDTIGEIKDFSIFVAVDSGGYVLFLTKTKDTSAIFTGENGKTYRFICIAEDLAGNVEVQDPVAEATTHLVVLCDNRFFRDADHDGYGNRNSITLSCTQPNGYVSDSSDCNDANANIHPGATELCNGVDDNCDGRTDEGCNNPCDLTVNAGDDVTTYFGYPPAQQVTRTAIVTGGTSPYTYSWSLGRPLKCNQVNTDGDEAFYGGSCSNNVCPASGSPSNTATCSGSETINAILIDVANICVTVTDKNGCTATDCFTVNASDIRCYSGNSGGHKVKICHHTNSSVNPWVDMCVDISAVSSHLAHGDYLGPCHSLKMNDVYNEEDLSINLRLFPNPAKRSVTIEFNSWVEDSYIVEISDITGRKLNGYQGSSGFGENTRELNLSGIDPGIYIVKLILDGKQEMKKLMIE